MTQICTCSWPQLCMGWTNCTQMVAGVSLKLRRHTGDIVSYARLLHCKHTAAIGIGMCHFGSIANVIDEQCLTGTNAVLACWAWLCCRDTIRLAPEFATVGVYTNLGALLMGAGQIENCLQALHTSIALAKQYQQTDSPLVRSPTHLLLTHAYESTSSSQHCLQYTCSTLALSDCSHCLVYASLQQLGAATWTY